MAFSREVRRRGLEYEPSQSAAPLAQFVGATCGRPQPATHTHYSLAIQASSRSRSPPPRHRGGGWGERPPLPYPRLRTVTRASWPPSLAAGIISVKAPCGTLPFCSPESTVSCFVSVSSLT